MVTGVQIGPYHTHRDWGLYLTDIEISAPRKKEYKISIPGANGSLDFSDALTNGDPKFHDREIRLTFDAETQDDVILFSKMSEISNLIHGRKFHITFDDDKGYYYLGVCHVDFERKNSMISSVTITALADPLKYEKLTSAQEWEWDTFNFHNGVIRKTSNIEIAQANQTVTILKGKVKQVPVIIVNNVTQSPLTVTHRGRIFNLAQGRNRFPQIAVGGEDEVLTFNGKGSITIEYRGASL